MSEQSDNVFRKLDEAEMVRQLADEWCGSDEQAAAFVHVVGRELFWTGVRLMWVRPDGTRTVALSDPNFKEHVKEKYGFLLKPEKVIPEGAHLNVELDPSVVESALANNLTAKGTIARAFGDGDEGAKAAELFLKAERAKRSNGGNNMPERVPLYSGRANGDDSDNPFSAAGWSKTRAGALYRTDPALCARLSKAAGFPTLDAAFAATKPLKAA